MNTLPEQDALIVVAEISVAVAGFGGIIAAIGKPQDPFARLAIKNVVIGAITIVMFSLSPILLSLGGLHDQWVWRGASAGVIVAVFVYYLANWSDIAFSFGNRIEWAFGAGDVVVGLVTVASVFGYPLLSYPFVYFGGLYWGLAMVFRYFAVSISSIWAGDD